MYTEKVIDHFTNPRNVGELEDANAVGQVGNPVCGDIMKMYLKIENDVIVDAKFKTFGCCAAIATSSVATILVKGMTIEQALQLKNKQVVDELGGLPPQKLHCSVLAEEAIRKALADYYIRGGMDEEEANKLCGVEESACDHCEAHEH
ncbi:MAG: Fe-S cluster assembly scaffold protein NifU [Clostridia bacterium]|nr:Fe-S cluster assembly scaffold protein NifU [Clostridia bacterium]